jgi:hypothetical protein
MARAEQVRQNEHERGEAKDGPKIYGEGPKPCLSCVNFHDAPSLRGKKYASAAFVNIVPRPWFVN